MSSGLPASLSIIIEWENAGRIGAERARSMLGELHRQLGDPALDAVEARELIFVHPDNEAAASAVAEAAAERGRNWPATLRFLTVRTDDYYEQKNEGAAAATGEVIVFLDSDVIPRPGWLLALLSSFATPGVAVAGGTTSVDHNDLYSAAMALGWFFPLPPDDPAMVPATHFYANNVAFRRALFARHPFPRTGQYRGQCSALAETLRREGHGIHLNGAAAVGHPPPRGSRAFVRRALWSGHDAALDCRRRHGWWRGTGRVTRDAGRAMLRVFRHRRRVGLGALGAVGAAAIVSAYQALRVAGFAATAAAPATIGRWLWAAEGRRPAGLSAS